MFQVFLFWQVQYWGWISYSVWFMVPYTSSHLQVIISGENGLHGHSRPPWKSIVFCEMKKNFYKPISFWSANHASFLFTLHLQKLVQNSDHGERDSPKPHKYCSLPALPAGCGYHTGDWFLLKCLNHHTEYRISKLLKYRCKSFSLCFCCSTCFQGIIDVTFTKIKMWHLEEHKEISNFN